MSLWYDETKEVRYMICPYCHREMETGYMKSSHFIHWGKDKSLGFIPDDIKLTKGQFFQAFFEGYFVKSYHCSTCNQIIIALDDIQNS